MRSDTDRYLIYGTTRELANDSRRFTYPQGAYSTTTTKKNVISKKKLNTCHSIFCCRCASPFLGGVCRHRVRTAHDTVHTDFGTLLPRFPLPTLRSHQCTIFSDRHSRNQCSFGRSQALAKASAGLQQRCRRENVH